MADTGYLGVPTVSPADTPPDDYIRVQDQTGAAIRGLGQQMVKTGAYFDQVAADDAFNHLQEDAQKLFYGDPSKSTPGLDGQSVEDTGYFGTVGRSALDGRPKVETALDERIKTYRDGLNPVQQRAFDNAALKLKLSYTTQTSNHADQQAKVWYGQVNTAAEANAIATIANNPLDPIQMATGTSDLINSKVKQAMLAGAQPGDEVYNAAVAEGKRVALAAQIQSIGVKDPARAIEILDKNRAIAGPAYDELYGALRERSDTQIATQAADGYYSGAVEAASNTKAVSYANPSLPVYQEATAAIPGGYSAAGLARLVMIESAGKPDAANASDHVGLTQFSASTAKEVGIIDRTDPKQSIFGAQQYGANNAPLMARILGRQPTDAELYLAHQQGPGGAQALLSNPNTLAKDALGSLAKVEQNLPRAIRDKAATMTSAEFVAYWTHKFNGTNATAQGAPVPVKTANGQSLANPAIFSLSASQDAAATQNVDAGMSTPEVPEANPLPSEDMLRLADEEQPEDPKVAAYKAVMEDQSLTPEQRQKAIAIINQRATVDAVVAETTAAAKRKVEDEKVNTFVTKMLNGETEGLFAAIANDQDLGGEKKLALTNALQADAQRTVAGAQAAYGPGFYAALQQITADPGNPGRIYSADQLLKLAQPGPNGEAPAITLAGFSQLNGMLSASLKQPDQTAVNSTAASMLASVKKQLSFQVAPQFPGDPGTPDPEGEKIFAERFLPKFWGAYNNWTTVQGKDPWEFLTEENVSKLAQGLRSPREMAMKEMLALQGIQLEDIAAPPAPAGVNEDGWKLVATSIPRNPLKPDEAVAPEKWLAAVTRLAENPTEQEMAWFDQVFAPTGISAADVFEVLSIAPKAAGEAEAKPTLLEEAVPAAPDAPATELFREKAGILPGDGSLTEGQKKFRDLIEQ